MEGIREEIISRLLTYIKRDMEDDCSLTYSIDNFTNFIKALTLESSLPNPDAEVDESAKQQTEAADAHMRDLGILFQLSGDHQKEVDEIFARMNKRTMSKVNASDKHGSANRETQLLDIIKATRKYVKQATFAAKHDTQGVCVWDGSTYTTIEEETKGLLSRIDAAVNEG